MALLLGPTLAAAESTSEDLGLVSVDIEWSDTPHCVHQPDNLPCPLGWDDNGTPTDLGDDTFYTYKSIESLDVDVPPIGPLQGTSFHYDPEEEYIGHHLIDILDSVVEPLERAIPPPLGDYTHYYRFQNSSALMICIPGAESIPHPFGPLCVPVQYGAPYTDRNGTRLPSGVNPSGGDTDRFVGQLFRFLRMCELAQLGGEDSLTCNLIPHLDELEQTYRDLTPRIFHGVSLNETNGNLMDPDPPARSANDAADIGPGTGRDASRPATAAHLLDASYPARPAHPVDTMPSRPPGRPLVDRTPDGAADDTETATLTTPDRVSSWLMPAGAAAAVLLPLAWALYQRITRERALRHESRQRLLAIVERAPGIQVADASRLLGLTYHTTAHHVRVLQRTGKVETVRVGRNVTLHLVGALPRHQRTAVANLRRGPQAAMLERLCQAPDGLGVTEVAAALGCAKSSAHAKLRRLAAQGLVQRTTKGRYQATSEGSQALSLLEGSGR